MIKYFEFENEVEKIDQVISKLNIDDIHYQKKN